MSPGRNPLGVHALVWTGGWSREDARTAVRGSVEAGYDLLEIAVLNPAGVDVADTRALLAEAGLRSACSLGLDFDADISSDDPDVAARGEDRLNAALDVVAGIGGEYLGGVIYSALGKYDRPPTARGREHMVAALRRLAGRAGGLGVTLGLEPVNRYESNVINTAAQAVAVIEEVGEPGVVVHLDVYHANIEEAGYAAAVAACGEHLGYVHIGESHRGYLGTGTIDFAEFFGALRTRDYPGPITFESFSRAVVSPDLSDRLGVWRDLWTDSMDLAVHARAYIERQLAAAPAAGTATGI